MFIYDFKKKIEKMSDSLISSFLVGEWYEWIAITTNQPGICWED